MRRNKLNLQLLPVSWLTFWQYSWFVCPYCPTSPSAMSIRLKGTNIRVTTTAIDSYQNHHTSESWRGRRTRMILLGRWMDILGCREREKRSASVVMFVCALFFLHLLSPSLISVWHWPSPPVNFFSLPVSSLSLSFSPSNIQWVRPMTNARLATNLLTYLSLNIRDWSDLTYERVLYRASNKVSKSQAKRSTRSNLQPWTICYRLQVLVRVNIVRLLSWNWEREPTFDRYTGMTRHRLNLTQYFRRVPTVPGKRISTPCYSPWRSEFGTIPRISHWAWKLDFNF